MAGKSASARKLLMIWKYNYSIIDWINYYRNDMIIYKIILAIAINLNFTTDICVILQEFNKYFLFYITLLIPQVCLFVSNRKNMKVWTKNLTWFHKVYNCQKNKSESLNGCFSELNAWYPSCLWLGIYNSTFRCLKSRTDHYDQYFLFL